MELWKQGAEAKLYKTNFYGKPCIVKERFTKSYRHPILDKSLTAHRIKSEIRAMLRCRMNGMYIKCIFKKCYQNNLFLSLFEELYNYIYLYLSPYDFAS